MDASLQFLGHSTVLLALDGVTIMTDPVLRPRVAHLRHHTYADLPPLGSRPDVVLISHLHLDHLDFPSLDLLGKDVPVIVPRGAGRLLEGRGFRNVQELRAGQTTRVGSIELLGTPAKHSGFRPPFGPTADCLGFVVNGSRSIYFAGDTDIFAGMGDLGAIDVALLPVWGWGPTLGPGHLDPARAAEALTLIQPRLAVPIHWGTLFPIGIGRWRHRFFSGPPEAFALEASIKAPQVDVRIVRPGAGLTIGAEAHGPGAQPPPPV